MLERILRNLVVNALRCTQGGRVLVTGRRRGERLCLAVRDTGPGIPAARLEEIFLEFRQLNNPQRDRNRGLGLGLAIVRRLCTLLDHALEVHSTVGRGSCFALSVPICAPAPADAAPADGTRTPAREACRHCILVLDDDRIVREAMQALLLGWGYRACVAASAEEALQRAADCPPDLLLVDYRLPDGVTGADAVEAIRAACGHALPAVVITGDTAPDRLREAVEHGYPLLHKPVQPAKLRSTLRYLTGRDGADPGMDGL
jgi:CheY-like chemotaxis protein